jgi:hypothetical protein
MTKKIIGLYQLITGVMGAIIIFASLLNTSAAKVALPQKVAGVVLFGLLAWAGYGLINKKREMHLSTLVFYKHFRLFHFQLAVPYTNLPRPDLLLSELRMVHLHGVSVRNPLILR